MNDWALLLIVTTAGSILSLVGGLYLLYGKKVAAALQVYAVPFAAGALLAATFFDLLPEALHGGDTEVVLMTVLAAFLTFFVLERSLSWFHHHHEEPKAHGAHGRTAWLVVIGDTLHNLLDGLAIGAAFLISPATGVVTAIAIAAHEIPQELGDFGLMLAGGMKKRRIVLVNLVSAAATVLGAAVVFGLGGYMPVGEELLLAAAAGFFLYIAASDIIPTIHAEPDRRAAWWQTAVLLLGVCIVAAVSHVAHEFIAHEEPDAASLSEPHDD